MGAFGVREVLCWFKDQKRHEVFIKTDCIRVVEALNSTVEDVSHFGSLIFFIVVLF